MASRIEVVIQQAIKTFTKYVRRVPDFTNSEVNDIKALADNLTVTDIHILQDLLHSRNLSDYLKRQGTTVDYLPVHEDTCISVGVFLLNEGAKLPIHDHPGMYGILKVLQGILKVTSYSLVELDKSVSRESKHLFYKNPLKAIKHPEVILKKEDTSFMLTPTVKNIHEVECIEGPAAFLDILSPPYENGSASAPRVCHYFEEEGKIENDLVKLVQVLDRIAIKGYVSSC